MARKRMFSLLVVDTDEFLDMPSSTQSLYYHLGMRADDDGFVSSPKKIVKLVNCSNDDLKLLIAKGFIIPFDSGIIAIRHWKLNNDLKKDRYTPTIYLNEKSTLKVNKNKVYSIDGNNLDTKWIQNGNNLDTQNSIDKNSIDKNSIDKNSIDIYTIEPELEKSVSKKEIEKILTDEFNTIWKEYPNKQGKQNALKSYIKARTKDKVEYQDVVDGLRRYLIYCKQNKKWYSPKNGSTWFNQQSWTDEYPTKEVTTKDIQEKIDLSDF